MKIRVLGGCMTRSTCPLSGQTFNFLQNMDQRSIFYYLLLQVQGLVLKRRLFKEENGEEGFGG